MQQIWPRGFVAFVFAVVCIACATQTSSSRASEQDTAAASIVQRQFDAYNDHDLQAFLATYSDTVKLYRMPASEPAIVGKQQLGEFYRSSRFNIPALRAELLHRTVLGNKIVDHERITGLGSSPLEAVAVYSVVNGAIETVWLFYPE